MTIKTDRYSFLQGRHFAIDLLNSARATFQLAGGAQDLIANLERALTNKPAAHAAGIQSVITEIKEAM